MEKTNDGAMMRQYNEIKAKHPTAVLLFRCGDFYETYEEDAKESARILGITLTKSKTGMSMAGFPYHALDTYLPKLIRAGKRVAICDRLEEITDKNNNKKNSEKSMRPNINKNESANVQNQDNAQVDNNNANEAVESVSVGEVTVDNIQPAMAPVEGSEYSVTSDGKDVTFSSVVPNIEPEKPKSDKVAKKEAKLSVVRLTTFVTKRGETAPRIIGFTGEDDPRWKPVYDEKQKLVEAYNKAKKKDTKAKMQSSPFGPAWLTDRETGEKSYCMTFGVRYMDVAQALCEAYNTDDREAWKQAEQAVIDCKNGIVAGYQAEKAARKAERAAKRSEKEASQSSTPAMSSEEAQMFDLFKRFMSGDKNALAQVNEVLQKAA